jgi:hypothetical protein
VERFLVAGPEDAAATFVFAHGAGAPMDSRFMAVVAGGLAERGIRVVRFEFPYMQRRRETGSRGAPDRPAVLEATWRSVVEELGGGAGLVIGGKSMGGRIASMVADEVGARGLVCLGYPFHPAGRPERTRTAHLAGLRTPTLMVQGERDTMGNRADVGGYELSGAIELRWAVDGDHSFKPRKGAGVTEGENVAWAVGEVAGFIEGL